MRAGVRSRAAVVGALDARLTVVRVLRIHCGPKEVGKMHGHPHSVTVFLAGGHFKMTMPDGKTLVSTVPKGKAVWEEAGPHSPKLAAMSFLRRCASN
jgi:hypothetical protein